MALPGFYNNPPAYMGFVGYVKLRNGTILGNASSGSNYNHNAMIVRATSADINISQEVSKPDVVDSRYDKTVYQLGPKIVEGSLTFPAVYDLQGGANIVEALYRYAVTREDSRGSLSDFGLDVKYANTDGARNVANFTYEGCVVNTWQFSVSAEDVVNITVDIVGLTRSVTDLSTPIAASDLTNTRIITWNDARVELSGGRLGETIGGNYIRSFEANINNSVERFYTLNTALFAQAIAPTKRDVDGSVVLLGRHLDLAGMALSNENFCSETTQIAFGFETKASGSGCDSSFGVALPNCVFEIEEMSLSNDLFETTINWHSLPAAGTGIGDPLLTGMNPTFTYPLSY